MAAAPRSSTRSAASSAVAQLDTFIDKFAPANQRLIRDVRTAMRERFPTANELVYDNYNFFVIGYCPTLRPSEAILSIAASAKGVSICFIQGATLDDPDGLLTGEGKQTRFLRVESADDLRRPDVDRLLALAAGSARPGFASSPEGSLVIRSISAKQRPRRAASD